MSDQEKFVKSLERQAATLKLTTAEIRRYDLAEKDLIETLQKRANAATAVLETAELESTYLKLIGRETDTSLLEFRNRFDLFRADMERIGNKAGLAWLDKIIPVADAKLKVDEVQQKMGEILSDQTHQERLANLDKDDGLISELRHRERILEIHKQSVEKLKELRPLLKDLAKQAGPVGEAAANILGKISDHEDAIKSVGEKLKDALSSGFSSGLSEAFNGLASGNMNLREATMSLGKSVLSSLTKAASDELATELTSVAKTAFAELSKIDWGSLIGGGVSALSSLFSPASGAAAGGAAGGAGSWLPWISTAMSFFGFAEGGKVKGPGTPTSDSILAALSTEEVVIRAASAMQPGATEFLLDFNARGMQALRDWSLASAIRHNSGGLAGVPAPSMATPGLSSLRLAEPAKQSTTLKNAVNLYAVQNPEEVASMAWGKSGQEHFMVYLSRNASSVRQLLNL